MIFGSPFDQSTRPLWTLNFSNAFAIFKIPSTNPGLQIGSPGFNPFGKNILLMSL